MPLPFSLPCTKYPSYVVPSLHFFLPLPLGNPFLKEDENYDSDFDEEATIDQFRYWGIDKVYFAGHCNRVLDIEEFLNRVKVHFVDQDEDYSDASFDEKARIFMN